MAQMHLERVEVLFYFLPAKKPLATLFGKMTPKRTQQITEILETLKALGH